MVELTLDVGEEYIVDEAPDGDSIEFRLFDQTTESIGESDDPSLPLGSEPGGSDYSPQSSAVSTSQLSGSGNGDYGFDNDAEVSFDVGDATDTVDHVAFVANFTSSIAGDGGDTDHIIAIHSLSESRDLSNYTSITFDAGDLEHKVSGS